MPLQHFERTPKGYRIAQGVAAGWIIFWFAYLAIKIAAIPVLVVNLIWLLSAAHHNTVGSFDFTWFVLSLLAFLFL